MPDTSPRWLREAARDVWHEARLFVTTFARVLFRPARFAREWLDGVRAMNPVGFAVACLGIVTLVHQVDWLRVNGTEQPPFWLRLAMQPGPYIHYAFIGAIAHFLLGARRTTPVGASVALALYVGGVVSTIIELLFELALLGISSKFVDDNPIGRLRPVALVVLLVALALFIFLLCRALGGAHRVSPWRPAAGAVLAFALSGGLIGCLPEATPGLFVSWFAIDSDGIRFAPSIAFLHAIPLF